MTWWPFRRKPTPTQLRDRFDANVMLDALLAAARTWGKPRGLTWRSLVAVGEQVLVHAGGPPLMLLPVEIRFDVLPGSDMEDVPQAREPRQATAVFFHLGAGWTPGDRVMLNLTPAEVLERNPTWKALFDVEDAEGARVAADGQAKAVRVEGE